MVSKLSGSVQSQLHALDPTSEAATININSLTSDIVPFLFALCCLDVWKVLLISLPRKEKLTRQREDVHFTLKPSSFDRSRPTRSTIGIDFIVKQGSSVRRMIHDTRDPSCYSGRTDLDRQTDRQLDGRTDGRSLQFWAFLCMGLQKSLRPQTIKPYCRKPKQSYIDLYSLRRSPGFTCKPVCVLTVF